MKKILSLSTKEWFSGVAQGYHFGSGLWASAAGINPFIDAQRANTRVGLLQAAPAVTDLTGAVVIDTPIGWTADLASNGDQIMYFNGTGTLYQATTSGSTISSVTANRTVANMANGISVFQPNGGTRRLMFSRGKVNVADETANYTVALGTTNWHHIILTYDGTNIIGYVDGVQVVAPTAASGNGSGTTVTGFAIADNMFDIDTTNYDFDIDEVAVYSRALHYGDVIDLYNGGSGITFTAPVAATFTPQMIII